MGVLRASVFVGCVAFVACPATEPASAPAPSPPITSAPFDVSAIVRQVERAFERDGERWATHGTGFSVRHSSAGLELTARHRPDVPLPRALAGPQRIVESAPVRLGPARLERGAWTASTDGLVATQADDGTLWLRGEGWAEHLQNEDVGVEQSWRFERLPGEAGDLVVTVPVQGAAHRSATASGEHLVDVTTGLGFRVGHGTFVDADHRETTVPVVFEAGALVLRVPEAVLQASRFPVVLDPLISPEFDVDEPVLQGSESLAGFGGISVASNGSGYLAAWTGTSFDDNRDVLAARLDGNGVLLDRVPLVLPVIPNRAPHHEAQINPVVASNGRDYLVLWLESSSLRAVRISASGTVLDPAPLLISNDANMPYQFEAWVSAASNGVDYLVAWNSSRELRVARVSSAGAVLDPQGISLSTWAEAPVSLVSSGSGYRVLWLEPNHDWTHWLATTTTIESDGGHGPDRVLLADAGLLLDPSVAQSDGGFLATWTRRLPNSSNVHVEGLYLSAAGVPLTTAAFALSDGPCAGRSRALGTSNGFLVSWVRCDGTLVAGTLTPDGSVQAPLSVLASSVESSAMASSGPNMLVAFDARGARRAQLIDPTGQPLGATVLFTAWPDLQRLPSIATVGDQSLVVWDNDRNIYGARITRAGAQLDPSRILISRGGDQALATVATNGTEYFVVWLDGSGSAAEQGGLAEEGKAAQDVEDEREKEAGDD